MIILYLGWSTVRAFMYKRIECKNNKGLVRCMDRSTINRSIGLHCLHFIFDLRMISIRWIDRRLYYYVDWSNVILIFDDDSKIETLFGVYWSFCLSLKLINCWWLGKWWTCCYWARGPKFLGELKNWLLKNQKRLLQFFYRIECMKETPRKNELS